MKTLPTTFETPFLHLNKGLSVPAWEYNRAFGSNAIKLLDQIPLFDATLDRGFRIANFLLFPDLHGGGYIRSKIPRIYMSYSSHNSATFAIQTTLEFSQIEIRSRAFDSRFTQR